jgi:hypothetical protein
MPSHPIPYQNTLVDGHTPLLAARARGLDVSHAKGCNICDVLPKGYPTQPCPDGEATATSGIDAAIQLAQATTE